MSNFSKQNEERKEKREKDRNRREKLAGFFFSLSQVSKILGYGSIGRIFINRHHRCRILVVYGI